MSVKKNTTYNLAGALLSLGLVLTLTPTYIQMIGEARYGILATTWLLLGYFGVFDLGLGRAITQRIASLRDKSANRRASIFWTAFIINCLIGLIGGVIIWPVASYFFSRFFSIDTTLLPEILSATPWLIIAVPLATSSGVLTGALQGRNQFLEINIISLAGSFISQIAPFLVVIFFGPDLGLILPVVILSKIFILILLLFRCKIHVFGKYKFWFSLKIAKDLLNFGGWVTVTSLIGPLMIIVDRFLIGTTLGAKAITHYIVPFQIAEWSVIFPNALTAAIFPRLAALDEFEANRLALTSIRTLAALATPPILVGILLVEPFLGYWLNPDFALKAGLSAKILLLGFWTNAFAGIPYALLQAAGKPHIVAKCHVGELAPYLLLLYLFLAIFGLPGAAIAFSIRTSVDCALLMFFSDIFTKSAHIISFHAALLLFTLFVSIYFPIDSAFWFVIFFVLFLSSIILSFRTAPGAVREFVQNILGSIFSRKID